MVRIAESYSRQKEKRLEITRGAVTESVRRAVSRTRIAKEAATDAARQAVFQTSELIENIAVHLPARTIFGIQRVSSGFRNSIAKSPSIRDKLFLSKRDEPVTKVIVFGYQHTAAILNPLFEPSSCIATAYHRIQRTPTLAERASGGGRDDEMYGVAVARTMHVTLESSILDTFLLDKPFTIRKAYLEFRVGKDGPCVFINQDLIKIRESCTLRGIIRAVLSERCHLMVMSARAAQNYRRTREDRRSLQLVGSRGIAQVTRCMPLRRLDALDYELTSNAADVAWRFRMHDKPHLVIETLERLCATPAEIYFSHQEPTFLFKDLVIPSPQDWAKIRAKEAI